MEYTKKIEKLENQFMGARHRLNVNLNVWRPAYPIKVKQNLRCLKDMVDALVKINDEIEKQDKNKL